MIGFGEVGTRCSASGCTADALFRVNWRNPRIHGPERVKVWLACDAHREHLAEYLATRGFPVEVSDIDTALDRVQDPA